MVGHLRSFTFAFRFIDGHVRLALGPEMVRQDDCFCSPVQRWPCETCTRFRGVMRYLDFCRPIQRSCEACSLFRHGHARFFLDRQACVARVTRCVSVPGGSANQFRCLKCSHRTSAYHPFSDHPLTCQNTSACFGFPSRAM